MIGRQPVLAGVSKDVPVTIAAIYATRMLHVLLYEDAGKIGLFEKDLDLPIFAQREPVSTAFNQIVE